MRDEDKTKEQLIEELKLLRRQIAEQEALESERVRAEELVRKLSRAVEQSPSTVAITDTNGNFEYVNPKFTQLTGYAPEEAIGKTPRILKSGKNPPEEYRRLWHTITTGGEWRGELCNKKKNGELYWESASISPIRDSEGVIRCFVKVAEDITERKRMEGELDKTLKKLRRALRGTVHSLAAAVEMRDPYTSGHQRRVADLARAIATEMGLPGEQIDGIRMAGLIHDIGKIAIPAEILSKPGRLSDVEFSVIKTHPQVGYDILKEVEFPWPVAQVVLQHQERMNGSGYPSGISGDEILLEARILAVADVVEAMLSHRPYHPALGLDKALGEISGNRGVLYDADVVDACIRLFTEKGFEFKK